MTFNYKIDGLDMMRNNCLVYFPTCIWWVHSFCSNLAQANVVHD